ncbi:MAG: hypothetical protein IJ723_00900, partial [Ruminococcus sp.]|nr:hypothetical protein [Ruminococcus sp.]
GCTDSEGCLYIPHCAFGEQVNKQIYRIKKNVFRGSKYSEIYFNSNLDTVPANAFADSAGLTDLWFSGAIEFQLTAESVAAGCFYGLPDNITVHLPARIAEEDRSALEEKLKSKGIPSGAAFDYYAL